MIRHDATSINDLALYAGIFEDGTVAKAVLQKKLREARLAASAAIPAPNPAPIAAPAPNPAPIAAPAPDPPAAAVAAAAAAAAASAAAAAATPISWMNTRELTSRLAIMGRDK